MAFADLILDLNDMCNTHSPEFIYSKGIDETFVGEHTEQLFTNLKYGEALENIKSTATVYINYLIRGSFLGKKLSITRSHSAVLAVKLHG